MGEKCRNLQALRALSPAYAGRNGELTAALQYVYQSILLDGCGKTQEAKTILKIAVQEMHHLEKLGGLLVSFGVPPVFTACPPYPVAYYSAANVDYVRQLPQMLDSDIRAEREAIACYTRILRTVREKGFIEMQVAEDDRRKMYVTLTEAGKRHLAEKHGFLASYFDKYVEVLGEENISELTALLKLTADSEPDCEILR